MLVYIKKLFQVKKSNVRKNLPNYQIFIFILISFFMIFYISLFIAVLFFTIFYISLSIILDLILLKVQKTHYENHLDLMERFKGFGGDFRINFAKIAIENFTENKLLLKIFRIGMMTLPIFLIFYVSIVLGFMKVREDKSTFKAVLHYLTFGLIFKDHVECTEINEKKKK